MKTFRLPLIMAAVSLIAPAASYAQNIGIGMGMGTGMGFGYHPREIVKISPPVRETLHNYLMAEYNHDCPEHAKNPPETCGQTKPLYESEALPESGTHALPSALVRKLGFIQPGTTYVQRGFVVYLIRVPRHIILDSVAVHEDHHSSNIQW